MLTQHTTSWCKSRYGQSTVRLHANFKYACKPWNYPLFCHRNYRLYMHSLSFSPCATSFIPFLGTHTHTHSQCTVSVKIKTRHSSSVAWSLRGVPLVCSSLHILAFSTLLRVYRYLEAFIHTHTREVSQKIKVVWPRFCGALNGFLKGLTRKVFLF